MQDTREAVIERLLKSYRTYYDIHMLDDETPTQHAAIFLNIRKNTSCPGRPSSGPRTMRNFSIWWISRT